MQSRAERNKIISSLWTAKIIPLILTGVVGYATYVLVALLSVNYLLKKQHSHGAAISILVVYFLLFILMSASFLRLLYITTFDPPYVPLGSSAPPAYRHRVNYKSTGKARRLENGIALGEYDPGDDLRGISAESKARTDPDSPGLELFYTKDVFICEVDGRPSWCSSCANWKPDRTHHCSSSGRCVRKMDHFCPWVGGPIGENNFKFFIQFNGYTALYCIHLLVVMAIYIRQQVTTKDEALNPHFAAILALAGMFGLFTGSMFGTCIHLAMTNLTQVERLGSVTRAYQLAVLKPSPDQLHYVDPHAPSLIPYREITYPLENSQDSHSQGWTFPTSNASALPDSLPPIPSKTKQAELETPIRSTRFSSSDPVLDMSSAPVDSRRSNDSSTETSNPIVPQLIHPELSIETQQKPPSLGAGRHTDIVSSRDLMATRTFAVLPMETGENPWDLGSSLLNLETVMGRSLFEYILPFRRSPCCNHEDSESHYTLGPAVDRIKAKYHFMNAEDIRVKGRRWRPGRHSPKH